MRLYSFRKPEPNPWELDDERPAPPIGMSPLLDVMAMQHSLLRLMWEICRTHEFYGRALRWQGALLIFVSLLNVYWALMYWGHSRGWW